MTASVHAMLELWSSVAGAGKIEGGWEFVWAVYLLSWTVLSLYAVSLWVRRPRDGSRGSP